MRAMDRCGERRRLARTWLLALLVSVVACASPGTTPPDSRAAGDEPAPRFATGGPDAAELGAGAGYPKGDRTTFYDVGTAVGSHSHLDEIFPARLVHKAPAPSRLARVAEPPITWRFQGADLTLDDYLGRNPTTGLLIARGDTILVERYQYGRTDRHRFTSWSMAKTVTAMLVGIAIAEGHIRSVDDLAAAYVPALAGTEYGRTSLRHLLQMSSGVRFREDNTDSDDGMRLVADTYLLRGAGGPGAVTSYNERAAPAGTKFSYASVESQVLGLVLRAATRLPPAEYLESRIWRPIGAEADATWLIDNSGQEAAFCCLNAVLRDYARLALLLAHEGNWRARQIIPAAWIREATTTRADQPHLWPGVATRAFGYGYQTWIIPGRIRPGDRRMFMLWGVRGQRIYVDPQTRLVMVNTAVHKRSVDGAALRETDALWAAVVSRLGGSQAAEKGPSASLAPSAARSTYREYASRAAVGRRLASGPF
jgi:CubicO group peptidase (beta-lactamase class C family)